MIRRLLIWGLLAWGLWWLWTHYRPADDRGLSARVESAVNETLSRAGVTDAQVIDQIRKERSRWGAQWIESDRRIRLNKTQDLSALLSGLQRTASQKGCSSSRYAGSSGEDVLDIAKSSRLLQHLVFVTPPVHPQVALVIDDVAYETSPMDTYAALNVPLTFAILPRDKHCAELAQKAKGLGFGVILHLPMEPIDLAHNNPGGAGLYLKMTPEQLHDQFEKDVASVPGIEGINNHMGSAFTSNLPKMELVMGWVKEKNLFFLDSHTAPHSVVPQAAKKAGVPCLVNETFLDNKDDSRAIQHELDGVIKLALRNGRTIAIGHYRRKWLADALRAKIPEFKAKGVEFVTLPTFYRS